jgi:hypothetical protein
MSRLDKLFGPRGDGSSGIGSDAELVSLLNRVVADIDRLKRGAYQGPGASFTAPVIIDDYKLEFINETLVATSLSTGAQASFGTARRYEKAIFIGDEFLGFPPNSSSWGSSPFGASGGRWQDFIVQTYKIPVQVDGCVNLATATSLFSSPRVAFQSADLLVICVGSHDMLTAPGTGLATYKANLNALITSYPADEKLVVFPWGWFSAVTDYPTDYAAGAAAVAAESGCKFIDLNQLPTLSSSYVVNAASTTNSTPSLDGSQVIFAQVQAVLDA